MVGRFEEFRRLRVNQDVQVRAIDVIRPNVGGGRAAAPAVANGALYPTDTNLFTKREDDKYSRDNIRPR